MATTKCTNINAGSLRRCRWSLVSSASSWEYEHCFGVVGLAQQRTGPRLQSFLAESDNLLLEELNANHKASNPQVQTRQQPLWRSTSAVDFKPNVKTNPLPHCYARGNLLWQYLTTGLLQWQDYRIANSRQYNPMQQPVNPDCRGNMLITSNAPDIIRWLEASR